MNNITESSLHTVLITLSADLDDDQVSRFAALVSDDALSTSVLRAGPGSWDIQWLLPQKPNSGAFRTSLSLAAAALGITPAQDLTPHIEPIPDVNWLEQSYRGFAPFLVGSFYICGTHTVPEPEPGNMVLVIDAATAFGSGEHGTTSGCMLLMDALKRGGFQPRSCLDMGCGSGILAIAAHRLWDCPVLAVDIDPESVRVTKHHCKINGTGEAITAIAGNGFTAPSIDENRPYDMIIANILPQPLKDMASSIAQTLAPAGHVILSGILIHQADDVAEVYKRHGLITRQRLDRGEWAALLLGRAV